MDSGGVADTNAVSRRSPIAPDVAEWAAAGGAGVQVIAVHVRPPEVDLDFPDHELGGAIIDGKVVSRRIDGVEKSAEEADDFNATFHDAIRARNRERNARAAESLRALAQEFDAEVVWVDGAYGAVSIAADDVARLLEARPTAFSLVEFEGTKTDTVDLTSALESMDITPTASNLGYDGTDVGAWMNDGDGRPDESNAAIDAGDFTMVYSGGDSITQHATQMVADIMAAAPDVEVFWAKGVLSCRLRDDVDTMGSPSVFVSSLSSNSYTLDGTYTSCSEDWDEYVYDFRVAHFQAAGNSVNCADTSGNLWIADRAKGYNVIAAGGYDDGANPEEIWSGSCWKDPETQASKPEVVAPAVNIVSAGFSANNGTSHSAPLMAGLTASLMEPYSHLRLRPEAVKAYLMSGAREMNTANATMVKEKEGAGRVNFGNSYYNGYYHGWSGSPTAYFSSDSDSDGKNDVVESYPLVSGRTYRVVIAWLVRGTYVTANLEPNFDFNLQVRNPSGTVVASSASTQQSFEAVEFTASTSGTYTFTIDRASYSSTAGNLALALHVSW